MRYSKTLLHQATTATIMSSSALSNVKKTLTAPFVGAFQVGALIRFFVNTLSHKYTQIKQMLADPLLTEHYAKAGLRAVLIDQQHGLSFSSYCYLLFVILKLLLFVILKLLLLLFVILK